jgi:glycerophosphoryl diester phosphodiesterase
MPHFIKIAHRGASGVFPENTCVAFRKAIDTGADMIELDCQLTQDGHVVVFHDEKLSRVAKACGTVGESSLEELKRLDIGGWFKRNFRDQRIQTLEEVLTLINGDARLCIDIKQFAHSPSGIELKLLFILSHFDYLDRVILSSLDYRSLARVRELAPGARIGLIYGRRIKEDPLCTAISLRAGSIHVQKELASRDFVQRAWDEGLDVYVWTLNHLREISKFASLGVQGIMSDYPELFSKLS